MNAIQIHMKKGVATDAMKQAAYQEFSPLLAPTDTLMLTVEQVKRRIIQIKAHYHGAAGSLHANVLCDDFYEGLSLILKKLERQLQFKPNREKLGLGEALKRSSSETGDELSQTDPIIAHRLTVPIYTMTEEEAFEQMLLLGYQTLIYSTPQESDAVRVLTRQADGEFKQYTGLYL